MRKIIVTVAPVCHTGKVIPEGCKNPLTPEEITEEVLGCIKAGASIAHLHTRTLEGELTNDLTVFTDTINRIHAQADVIVQGSTGGLYLTVFTDTINRIHAQADVIVQGSTGGLSSLTLEERCVSLNVPDVEMASLNMGSVNFGETVYVNTMPELRYWAGRMKETNVIPEMELFDLSHVECCSRLADEGVLRRPLHYNFCVGPGNSSNLSATGRNLALLNAITEQGSSWGITHDSMRDFQMLACAIGMGANTIRVGFEDSFYYAEGKRAKNNIELVERVVALIRAMGCEPATVDEAREILGVNTYWK